MAESTKTIKTVVDFIPGAYGTVFKLWMAVFDFAHNFGRGDPIERALDLLWQAIREIQNELQALGDRVDTLAERVIQIENRNRVQRLKDFAVKIERLHVQIDQQPVNADVRQLIAVDAGAITEAFLSDLDLWSWTDIEIIHHYDDYNVLVDTETNPMAPDFKSYPALPIFVAAVGMWLVAIDLDTGGNYARVQRRYGDQLRRLIAKVSVRPAWDELAQPPDTFSEHIMARITCYPSALHKYAQNGECAYSIFCNNVMERRLTAVSGSDFVLPAPTGALCTANENVAEADERRIENDFGIKALTELGELLSRVEKTGTLRESFSGHFDTSPFYNVAFLYLVNAAGEVLWFKQRPSTQPGTLTGWDGPRTVKSGWGDVLSITPAGGNRFYVLRADGILHWYQHDDFNDGGAQWKGPVDMGVRGWNGFSAIVPGSDGVLYAMHPDGKMLWYRHDGFTDGGGIHTWRGPRQLTLPVPVPRRLTDPIPPHPRETRWGKFKTVFSGGGGVLYAVASDGTLWWYRHMGFIDGDDSWDGPREVGTGWHDFSSILGLGEGVIYAVTRNGALLWYRHKGWKTGGSVATAEGPIVAASSGWSGYRHVFQLLPATLGGIG